MIDWNKTSAIATILATTLAAVALIVNQNSVVRLVAMLVLIALTFVLIQQFLTRRPKLKFKTKAVDCTEATKRYRQRIEEEYQEIRIFGKSEPIELEGIFTDVYILDKITGRQHYELQSLKAQFIERTAFSRQSERHKGLDFVKQSSNNLFILGKPGAGKTTFLKYIALQAARGELKKLPVFISLHRWSKALANENTNLLHYIVQSFEVMQFPDPTRFVNQALVQSELIILCDGLDEVTKEDELQDQVITQLEDFRRQYPHNQYLVTCRVTDNLPTFDTFQDVEVADFNNDQIKTFVSKWFSGKKAKRQDFLNEFYKPQNETFQELGNRPILLALLCMVFDSISRFPTHRSSLYDKALDELLGKWDSQHNIRRDEVYRVLDVERKKDLFAEIAAKTFWQNNHFFAEMTLVEGIEAYLNKLPRTDVSKTLDGKTILKAIEEQHGIFVERAMGIYSFSHLTFQEYFTAHYIVDHVQSGILKELLNTNHILDDTWQEVILMTANLLENADDFFELFIATIADLIVDNDKLVELIAIVAQNAPKEKGLLGRVSLLQEGITQASTLANKLNTVIASLDSGGSFTLSNDSVGELARLNDSQRLAISGMEYARVLTFANIHVNAIASTLEPSPQNTIEQNDSIINHLFEGFFQDLLIASRSANDAILEPDAISAFGLESKQFGKLKTYLKANRLLIDCLALSSVTDRKGIEDSILLPPER